MDNITDSSHQSETRVQGSDWSGNAEIIEHSLTDNLESATAVLPLEPPDSGDFQETFVVPDGSGDVAMLLGDVTGHGAPAAEKANKIQRLAVASLKAGCSPLETVEAVNSQSQTEDDRYATFFVARVDGSDGTIRYANAGHEPPLIADTSGETKSLPSTGPPLGVVPPEFGAFSEHQEVIAPGGTLLATTDGVLEARNPDVSKPVFFGYERLVRLLKALRLLPPVAVVRSVLRQVMQFSRSIRHDDVVVMALRRKMKSESVDREQNT